MPAKVIKIDLHNYRVDLLSNAAKVLSEGGLVVFPTETVYGLGVNANIPSAVERLYEVKNNPATRPFTVHLASADDVYCHTATVPRLALRLMKAFWPGPLTLVLPVSNDNGNELWMGFRTPDHRVAQELIKMSKAKVIASSANLTGQPAPLDAGSAISSLGDKVDVIIDAGTTKIGVSSTVLKVFRDNRFEVLREGSIKLQEIQHLNYKLIIFVCSGNTCRSPMAMGLFRKMMAERKGISVNHLEAQGYKIISAGTSAIYSSPASQAAIEVMREAGADIMGHLSQPVTLSMLEEADEIYVMTKGHLTTLKEWAPLVSGRIKLFDPDADIEDPIGSGKEVYKQCAAKIQKALEKLICQMK